MPNAYAQVALTYVRRPCAAPQFLLIGLGSLAGFGLVMLGNFKNSIAVVVGIVWILATFAAVHLKQQFADARAHLLPRYRPVHALVAAAVLLTLAGVFPGFCAWLWNLPLAGVLVLTVSFLALALWGTLRNSYLLATLPMVLFFGLLTDKGQRLAAEFFAPERRMWALALLATSAIAAALGFRRMIRLNEDQPEFHSGVTHYAGRWTQMTGQQRVAPPPAGSFRDWLNDRHMNEILAHARQANTSARSRVARWQVGTLTGIAAWLVALALVAYWQVLSTVFVSMSPVFLFQLPIFILPAVQSHWFTRAPMLGYESLLPVERRAYVQQMGLALLWSQTRILLLSAGLCLACLALVSRQPLMPDVIALLIAIYALWQVWSFGVFAWFLQYRTPWAWMGGMMLGVVVMPPLLAVAAEGHAIETRLIVLGIGAALAGAGLLLAWAAYRRWLQIDLD